METKEFKVMPTEGGHWYKPDGTPFYQIEKADGKGMRPTTLRDAKKLGLIPGVTEVLKMLAKPGLESYKKMETIMATITTPRLPGEGEDEFAHRVFNVEGQDTQEASNAADLGRRIHGAIELSLTSKPYDPEMDKYINGPIVAVSSFGKVLNVEKVVVGLSYAGKFDMLSQSDDGMCVVDFKSCRRMPDSQHIEWRLQLAAYCDAVWRAFMIPTRAVNIAISTTEPGKFEVMESEDWRRDFEIFSHLLQAWKLIKGL